MDKDGLKTLSYSGEYGADIFQDTSFPGGVIVNQEGNDKVLTMVSFFFVYLYFERVLNG